MRKLFGRKVIETFKGRLAGEEAQDDCPASLRICKIEILDRLDDLNTAEGWNLYGELDAEGKIEETVWLLRAGRRKGWR